MLAIVSLAKAKHCKDTEKASFDREATALPHVSLLSDGIPSVEEGAPLGPKGDQSPDLMLYVIAEKNVLLCELPI